MRCGRHGTPPVRSRTSIRAIDSCSSGGVHSLTLDADARLSNTLDTSFCLEALKEAVATAGRLPEIFHTDQGCHFTSSDRIRAIKEIGTQVSMDTLLPRVEPTNTKHRHPHSGYHRKNPPAQGTASEISSLERSTSPCR